MRGFTLVEAVVSLALLGLMAGITGLAFRQLRPRNDDSERALNRARTEAITGGVSVPVTVDTAGGPSPRAILFLPDGRVLRERGDSQ